MNGRRRVRGWGALGYSNLTWSGGPGVLHIGLLVKFFIAASSLSFAMQIRVGNIIGKQGSYALGLLNFTVVSIQHVCFLRDSFCILIVLVVLASRAHLRGTYYYYSINLLPKDRKSVV